MNQNEQMLREALREAMEWNWLDGDVPEEIVQKCEQALAAEPAPLVRLTEEEIDALREVHLQHQQIESYHEYDFARAIMDAMIAKNGGK